MKQGTVSVLFGCHSLIHSFIVLVAWHKLYGKYPAWWQIVCILLHDIGHWGTNYLDNYEEKKQHYRKGSIWAARLFGQTGFEFVAGHCSYSNGPRSLLHDPDKYSWVIAPIWWMVSNTWFEPKLQRKGNTRRESAIMFKEAMRKNMDSGFIELGHEIYLRQWGHSNNDRDD